MIRMRPVLRFVRHRILHVDDSPERTARGIAVGLFAGFLPLFGLQMIVACLIAACSRANKIMAMLISWFSNPLTAFIIYYPCYRLGSLLLARSGKPQYGAEQLEQIIEGTFASDNILTHFFTAEFWKQVWSVTTSVGLETLIGGIILGLISAKLGYWLSLYIIRRYRLRKRFFLKKLALRRQQTA